MSTGQTVKETFPPGLSNAFLFAIFNALSFQIVLGSPIVLYAQTLGASATVLGIISALMPLLVIFQIPAAQYIGRIGYKRFVLSGWAARVVCIFGLALVPLTSAFLDGQARLALVLALLFGFNLLRGISSCAWLPWITMLVPAQLRGRYLARDAAVTNLASFGAFVVGALCLYGDPRPWQFSLLFLFSAVAGAISLIFLNRMPDVCPPAEVHAVGGRVPWREMAGHKPFTRQLLQLVVWSVAYGGITPFTVAFLKSWSGLSEAKIMMVAAVAFLGGLSSQWFLGAQLDKLGSKPVLGFACAAWTAVSAGWLVLAGGAFPSRLGFVLMLQFLMGLLAALVNMANTRLAMAIIPAAGRDHYFAVYSVVGNLALGVAPIGWGLMIDAVGARQFHWLGLNWNKYALYYAAAAVVFTIALLCTRRLVEPEAAGLEALLRDILIESPYRFWLRFWPRS
ncbi:MAG: MFS transporter [Verrucomicrobiae bacterium]|nr:MFS transporter [Verrucomicrobiae bacterium]